MKVTLLGTGAADGWPQPFCRCVSCVWAREHGPIRGRSCVLIDDSLLLDPSPDTATAAARVGVALDGVRTVLVGHAHPDHLDPSLLLARSWVPNLGPLAIYGPPSALAIVEPWIDPAALQSGAITLHHVEVGVEVSLDSGHIIRALPAEHGLGADGHSRRDLSDGEIDAVLWEVTSPLGARMMHAADTGPLPDSTVAAMRRLDLLLLEETFGDVSEHRTAHLNLATFAHCLSALRRAGVVDDATEVIAVHLSHHNPPEPELLRRLGEWGARPGRDGDRVHVGDGAPRGSAVPGAQRTLVTGGARSGKSREAERLVSASADVTYVATAAARENDAEWDERVQQHRQRRPDHWRTVESGDLAAVVLSARDGEAVLVDCLTLWLTRLVDDADAWNEPERARLVVREAATGLVTALRSTTARIVLVTNEVGSGIVPIHASARLFRDLLGEANARIAEACDAVVLTVAGQAVPIRPTTSVGGMA